MVPQLVPGAHLLRRRDNQWQVGLDPAARVVLPAGSTVGAPVLPASLPWSGSSST